MDHDVAAEVAVRRQAMVDAVTEQVGPAGSLRAVRQVLDVDAGGLALRLYRDGPPETPSPVLLYAHGGGWVLGDLSTHDGLCRHLAVESGWAVLAVDYRRAPEAQHPAQLADLAAARDWLRRHGPGLGLDPGTVAVGGDSAGGHLAAVAARRARDAGEPYAAQVLVCPVISPAADYPDLDNEGLDRDEMGWYWRRFLPPGADLADPDVDPLRLTGEQLAGLPPAVVVTAELDILRAEGETYAARLAAAGVPVVASRYLGRLHNFPRKLALTPDAAVALTQVAAALRALTGS